MDDDKLTLDMLRADLTATIERINQYLPGTKPPVVQEITLALRHVEDARMRLGIAECYEKGINPWVSKIPENK
jgi:hypothetical protein